MVDSQSDNKRIAKNTVMLYLRMILSIIVSLYTSRVVLQTLGVEDYGIFGVVGGVVSMFTFLNSTMAGATSRFLSYEMGLVSQNSLEKGGTNSRLSQTFSSALLVHIFIALFILVLAITIGLWFLREKLVIPEDRMTAAYWVYFCSIISMFINVTQVPYNAAIISHERMDVYAYVELLNVVLKLLIVYLLLLSTFDKLIVYAFLYLLVSFIVAFAYRVYCLRYFYETHFHFVWNPSILKPMLAFSGWNLYGVFCNMGKTQGINFVVNFNWGVAVNAATSIATTVQGTFNGLASQVTTAITPQVVKNYALGDMAKMETLMLFSVKLTGFLMGLFVVPMLICCDSVMSLWLVDVPEYAVVFCKIQMITGLCGMMNSAIYNGIYAAGRMKDVNVITGTLYLLSVPTLYILYKMGFPPTANQWLSLAVGLTALLIDVIMVKRIIPQIFISRFVVSIMLTIVIIAISAMPTYFVTSFFEKGLWEVVVCFSVNGLVLVLLALRVLFTKEQRKIINNIVRTLVSTKRTK